MPISKIIVYAPIIAGFFIAYFSLDINMEWTWRIPDSVFLMFYLVTWGFWYFCSWLFVKIKCTKTLSEFMPRRVDALPPEFAKIQLPDDPSHLEPAQKSAALFNRRMLLMQLGYLPTLFGMYIGHWILRNAFFGFGVHSGGGRVWSSGPSFAYTADITYTIIALGLIAIWFACSMNSVKNGLSKAETVLLLNAAAVLALLHFLYRLTVHNLAGAELTIAPWGGIGIAPYGYTERLWWWTSIDPMNFYEHISRLFIRYIPWIPADNLLLPVFISFGLLLIVSIAGAKAGKSRKTS